MFKYLITLVHFSVTFVIFGQMTGYASDDSIEAQSVYENAIHSSPVVAKIHTEGLTRRKLEAKYLDHVVETVNTTFENGSIDKEQFHKAVVQNLKFEEELFQQFDSFLKENYKPGDKGATYQLLYNKMRINIGFALELAKQQNIFFDILDKKLAPGYSIDPPSMNYFPQDEHIYSNGKRGNGLKTLLMVICGVLKNGLLFQDLDQHPFMHILQLPNDFDTTDIKKSQFFYSDDKTPAGLIIIHNGYAFGGHRNELRYPKGKKWGPEDCSSLVAKKTACAQSFSTRDQAYLSQAQHGFTFPESAKEIVEEWHERLSIWQQSATAKAMHKIYIPLNSNLALDNLKAGDIQTENFYKGIKTNPRIALQGTGGHTGFFIGTLGSGPGTTSLTMGANRDLEGNGREFIFGIEKRPLFSTDEMIVRHYSTICSTYDQ